MVISKKFRARLLKREPHPIDVYIGRRLYKLRHEFHISQTALADKVGLTFQQIQKYEKGDNRLSCSRLWMICEAMEINVSSFFVGIDARTLRKSRRWQEKLSEEKMNQRQWQAIKKWEEVEENARRKAAKAMAATSGKAANAEPTAAAVEAAKNTASGENRVPEGRAATSNTQPPTD